MKQNTEITRDTPRKRQRMAPEERRERILDAAQALFYTRGWDDVTVADILAETEISKGGFYHHFSAKEDLLDGIIERFTKEALNDAEASSSAAQGDALARFNAFLSSTARWKAERSHQLKFFVDAMLRPGNDVQFHRILLLSCAAARPILRDIIADGAEEGCFDVPDVDLAAETILAYSNARINVVKKAFGIAEGGDLEGAAALLNDRMIAEGAMLDRVLGLPEGSIKLANPTEYRIILRAMLCDK
ncbi:TetR/AcrR family transcriptional regulator (plasmid) [Falsihalocynthiibacter sp. SS001]|uniref:TetR/AcrR family transcriptional regulator n=1 Tax=Falsihalocynthiibacter sp. SS001 TaxID=3349698 RepID=UPI0036D37A1E